MKQYESELREFEERGVTILPGVFDANSLQPLIQEIEDWLDQRAKKLFDRNEILELHGNASFEQRYKLLYAQSKNIGKGLDTMFMLGPVLYEFLFKTNLLDALEPLLGTEITCNPIQHLRAKPPSRLEGHEEPSFHNVPWHQDAGVMMAEADASNIITCWLPLTDVTVEMGCMKAMPDCSNLGYIPHIGDGETRIDPALLPDKEPVDLICNKGDVVIMSRFTPHSSTPNRSEKCRWSLDLRYQTTGHHTGRTAHPEFAVRSSKTDVVKDYLGWRETWIHHLKNPTGFSGHRIHQSTGTT